MDIEYVGMAYKTDCIMVARPVRDKSLYFQDCVLERILSSTAFKSLLLSSNEVLMILLRKFYGLTGNVFTHLSLGVIRLPRLEDFRSRLSSQAALVTPSSSIKFMGKDLDGFIFSSSWLWKDS